MMGLIFVHRPFFCCCTTGVLQYSNPLQFYAPGGELFLTTASFTPPLFGLAGIIIGSLYLGLDAALETPVEQRAPSGPKILCGISFFTFQYWLSGLMCGALHAPLPTMHATMVATMVASWVLFDRSKTGLLVGVATGIGGPSIEIFLINHLHLYSYLHADLWGVDSWIPWVYAAGAPAVGNLARGYRMWVTPTKLAA